MKQYLKYLSLLAALMLVPMIASAQDFNFASAMAKFWDDMAITSFFVGEGWKNAVMICIACFLLWLAIRKQYEPLLLLPIAFGMLLSNIPSAGLFHTSMWNDEFLNPDSPFYHSYRHVMAEAAQLGIFATFLFMQLDFMGFDMKEAASIGIIGGADGPTAIFLTSKLAPHLLGPIAVAAYSYMALVPVIQPPIMRALTTEKERKIQMKQLREVSKREKILFPIIVAIIVSLILPSAATLIGCLMLGNLMKESGVVERLSKAAQNELNNIVVIFLGTTVGATATAEAFLNFQTIKILVFGIIAFGVGTAGGVLLAKFMNLFVKEKINPLIGSAGVSAVPMAARVSQAEGQKANPRNFLLMHAMGPNVAGVIGSAVAAGILLSFLG